MKYEGDEDTPQGDLFGDNCETESFETAEKARLPKVKPQPTSRDVSKDAPPPEYAARPEDLSDRALLEEIGEKIADAKDGVDNISEELNSWEANDFLPSIMERFERLPNGINNFLTPKQRACVLKIYKKIC